ncbi:MAG: hypothetical protein KOO61_01800 [Spirochaetales bacterium]|nr:hypothetical protein [Spirochaetales bacterium]
MKRALFSLIVAVVLVVGAFAQADSLVLVRAHGSLAGDDASYASGAVDWYDIQAPADGRIEAVAVSVDAPMTLLVRRGGQSVEEIIGGRGAARTSRSVVQGESLAIGVTTGYAASLVWPGPAEYMLQIVFASGDAALAVGGFLTGNLESGDDEADGGSYIDWYPLPVSAGIRLRVDVSSVDFDTYLIVELPGGGIMENDDTMGTNSSVGFTSATDGAARVGVRSFGYGETGQYEVAVVEEEVILIGIGEIIAADLIGNSAVYSLQGFPGQAVEVDLSSFEIDTILSIDDSDGADLYSDDYGNSTDSHLLYAFGDSGIATITVSSYGGRGEYTLSVRESTVRIEALSDGYRLEDGDVINGQLGPRSPQLDGIHYQRFTFHAERDERVEITLESDSFDSFLRIVDPGGLEWTDDDSAGNYNSRLTFNAERSGIHEVYASPLGYAESGLYTIFFTRAAAGRQILSTRGQLTPNDETDISGKSYDIHEFQAQAGRTVVIDVMSSAFDAQAVLRDQFGTVILRDDDGGSDSNSRIEFVPDRTAFFELVVTSYSPESYGNYTVTIYE